MQKFYTHMYVLALRDSCTEEDKNADNFLPPPPQSPFQLKKRFYEQIGEPLG